MKAQDVKYYQKSMKDYYNMRSGNINHIGFITCVVLLLGMHDTSTDNDFVKWFYKFTAV